MWHLVEQAFVGRRYNKSPKNDYMGGHKLSRFSAIRRTIGHVYMENDGQQSAGKLLHV